MPALTIKNIPQKIYDRLRAGAHRHHRSMNGEAIACLDQVLLGSERVEPEAFLEEVRILRGTLGEIYIRDEDIDSAKAAGRP